MMLVEEAVREDVSLAATEEDLRRYRNAVFDPFNEYPPTEFTVEEQAWLDGDPYEPALYVESLEELRGDGENFDAVIWPLAYRTLKTLIVGLSKAGKSFTTWAKSAEAIGLGKRVLYLTEEPKATVSDKVDKFGLEEAYGKTFFPVRRNHPKVAGLTWAEVVVALAQDVRELKIDLVVVDTVRPWVNLDGDESNNADKVGQALDALSPVCEAGAAVLVLHQSPWTSKRARNSTEFHAASDLIFHIEGEGDATRTIKYIGGRVEDVPAIQNFHWTGGSMEDLGKMRHDKAQKVGEVLRVVENSEEPWLTADDISEATDYAKRTVLDWLGELEQKSKVVRIPGTLQDGRGREPDRFRPPGQYTRMLIED